MRDLGSRAAMRVGSSPFRRTTSEQAAYRLLRLFSKVRAHSFRCSSSPAAIRSAGFAVGLGAGREVNVSKVFTLSTSPQASYRLRRLFSKVTARSFRYSSSPTAIRFAGFAVGFGGGESESWSIESVHFFHMASPFSNYFLRDGLLLFYKCEFIKKRCRFGIIIYNRI